MPASRLPETLDYKPQFPANYTPKVGIIGAGGIVKLAHLPAYQKYGVEVAAVYDIDPAVTESIVEEFGVERVASSFDDLLGDSDIEVVDIATFPQHRAPLIRRALEAGKHVLSQKPLAIDMETARELVEYADRLDRKLAVNQNGRYSPAWRTATLLVEQGAIGDIISVTHLFDRYFGWTVGTQYEQVPHWAIYDYAVHWIDITRCWMGERTPVAVRAREFRTSNQPPESMACWGMTVEFDYEDGAHALIHSTGASPAESDRHPFLINGTGGKIRGSALGNDYVEAEQGGPAMRYELEGAWFPDGFAGTIAELFSAITEDREPSNSARHNLLSLEMTLAACESADRDGAPVTIQS
jgi:predicted dehydrogenase